MVVVLLLLLLPLVVLLWLIVLVEPVVLVVPLLEHEISRLLASLLVVFVLPTTQLVPHPVLGRWQ